MASEHTINATWVQDRDLGAEVEAKITFRYTPGRPAQQPAYSHGGLPPDPPEVEFVSVTAERYLQGDAYDDHRQSSLDTWAEFYLSEKGFDDACIKAEEDLAQKEDR